MSEPITIGGQTFIKNDDGWVDKKTKVRAPEGLTKLLETMSVENTPSEKKKRVRVDTSRPVVKLGKSEYVWDLNGKIWIDRKTKDPVNPNFSKLIEATYQSTERGVTPDDELYKKSVTDAVLKNTGSTGQAAKQRTRKPTGAGQFNRPSIKINSPIVIMIEKLAVIDGYLKQRLDNQKLVSARSAATFREQQIETPIVDAQPIIDEEKIDAEVEAENKKTNAALLVTAVGAAGLIASQFDPVKEAFTGVVDFAKGVYSYLKDFLNISNSALETVNSVGKSIGAGGKPEPSSTLVTSNNKPTEQTPPVPTATSQRQQATPVAPQSAVTSPVPEAEEIVVTAPRRSSSSSRSNAPRGSSSASSSQRTSSMPVATRTTASPPTSTPPVAPSNPSLAEAQNGTVWAGKDASGMTTFVRKINGKYETWNSGDSTHYQIDEGQAQTQISTRNLQNVNTGADRRQPVTSSGVIQVNHPDTGSGWGIPGAIDAHGRPLAFSKEGAEAFYRMMQDSNGAVKPSDVASSKRSQAKNASVDGATNSPHLRGVAMDIHGTSGPWIRKHGAKYGWAPHDYTGTHGGHFVFGGPGMTPDEGAPSDSTLERIAGAGLELTKGAIEAISNIISAGAGDFTRTTGSQLKEFNTDMSSKISAAARERNAAVAASKTKEDIKTASDPLNLNSGSSTSMIQNVPTKSDKAGVEQYLTRMGFPKIEYHVPVRQERMA